MPRCCIPLAALVLATTLAVPMANAAEPEPPKSRRTYTFALKTPEDFKAYSKEVAGERFTKFVLDVRNGRIYFFDVKVYPVHKQFVFAKIYREKWTRARQREFAKNYGKEKPEFILGYIVHHLVPDLWTMSLWEGDKATPEHITMVFKRLRRAFGNFKKLKFRPDSTAQERMARKLSRIPVITNDKVYKASAYTAFNTGRAIGTLKVVAEGKAFEDLSFARDEIVILPDVLSDITPVAGIVSEKFSTPLAHVNLRAKAWNVPNIGLVDARKTYGRLAGKTVLLEATHKAHTLREATAEEIASWKAKKAAKKKVVIPKADLTVRALRSLPEMSYFDASAYGAKAANLGVVAAANINKVSVPAGFGIPIAYYADHMKRHRLGLDVRRLLRDEQFKTDAAHRKRALAELRKKIREAPLDQRLLDEVMAKVKAIAGDGGVFVRSSTNAEDLPGFNGAGLYDTVANAVGREAISKGIRKVWASVWNLVAFEEREHFRIKHETVYGAILVQKAVNPTAAGVLVTKHPNNPAETTTYTINAKSGLGLRVVGGKKIPEVVLYDYRNGGLRVLSRSDEDTMLVADPKGGVKVVPVKNPGKPVLTDWRARRLGRAARKIEKLFQRKLPAPVPLDMEWLYEDKQLHIVQVRPFVVHSPTCPCNAQKVAGAK